MYSLIPVVCAQDITALVRALPGSVAQGLIWGIMAKLKNKKIFLFGTAGFGGSDAYFEKILGQVKQSIDASNTVIGEYMCQGKMPQSVRERYMKMKENPEHPANLDLLIQNFDRALSHPDSEDLERLKKSL